MCSSALRKHRIGDQHAANPNRRKRSSRRGTPPDRRADPEGRSREGVLGREGTAKAHLHVLEHDPKGIFP